MALVKSRAIVLRTYKLGETSRIVVCYTEDYGKVRLVAKGVRKGGGRFGAALEPFMVSGVVFYHRPGRELSLVSQAEILREFPALRRDVVRMAYAAAVLELVDRLISESEPDRPIFELIGRTLGTMETASAAELDGAFWGFELALADALGVGPQLSKCVLCGAEPVPGASFVPRVGGAVCGNCLAARPEIAATRGITCDALLRLERGEDPHGDRRLTGAERDEISNALREFLEEHTGRSLKLKSIDFLAQIRRVELSGRDVRRDDEDSA